jgi:NAD(P)-dependent dehydrogenase (short-subunit alcohol dehydrogenase family)
VKDSVNQGDAGRVAVVSGAASGIGRGIAEVLAERDWRVGAVDRNAEGLEQVAGGPITPIQADLTRSADCERVAREAGALGPLKGLVNCAGRELHGSVTDTPEDQWDLVIDTNLKTMYLLSHHCLPVMAASGGGSVVNISSIQGLATQTSVAAYAASKGAVISLTRAMALDHAPQGIRVTCICPGTIDTPLVRANAEYFNPEDPEAQLGEWGGMHALGRIGTPREVGQVVAFMLSDEASFITGSSHLVDGGLLASF